MEKKEQNQLNINDAALAYMEQKYGEKFEYVGPWGASYANQGVRQMLVKSSSLPDEILVEAAGSSDEYVFTDNYLAIKYKPEMISAIQTAADQSFGASFVVYDVLMQTLDPELSADSSFEEYSTNPESGIAAIVAVSADVFEESLVQEFSESFGELGIIAQLSFVALDSEQYSSRETINIDDVIGQKKYRYFALININDDGVTIKPREVE